VNRPGDGSPAQPRSASRFIFERTPSTLAGTGASPSAAAISWHVGTSPRVVDTFDPAP